MSCRYLTFANRATVSDSSQVSATQLLGCCSSSSTCICAGCTPQGRASRVKMRESAQLHPSSHARCGTMLA